MKKIHVDEILKKKQENLPGPDRYTKQATFGIDANTTSYSMRKHLGEFDRHLGREKKRPGPGSYHAADLTGSGLTTSTMRSAT